MCSCGKEAEISNPQKNEYKSIFLFSLLLLFSVGWLFLFVLGFFVCWGVFGFVVVVAVIGGGLCVDEREKSFQPRCEVYPSKMDSLSNHVASG